MSTTSRQRRPPPAAQPDLPEASDARQRPDEDPDGGGDLHRILTSAVEETARLLDADGAMIYLVDPSTGHLRFAHDAGIDKPRTRAWIRSLELAPGTGMFGRAVADRTVVTTASYKDDPSFRHARQTDRIVDDLGITSMVVAPLKNGEQVFGALGTFSKHPDAFDAADVALVRSLAEHAAAAMANQRLIDEIDRSRQELDRSRAETARRADAEQALREIAARITALRDPAEILQTVIELASRLVRGDGAILDLLDPASGNLRWAYDDGIRRLFTEDERSQLWISVGEGATGIAVAEDRVIVAGDDLSSLFPPGPENTNFYERTGFRSMIAAPISGETGPLGVIEVYAVRPNAFDDADARLIRALASQSAIAITNARLITELAHSRSAFERAAEVERTLREIAASVSAMRDRDEILQAVVDAATRLLRSSGAMIDLLDPEKRMTGSWSFRHVEERYVEAHDHLIETELEADVGVSGMAIRTGQVQRSGDYPTDERFRHSPDRDAFVEELHIRSVISAPLLQRGEVLGAITVYADRPDAFDEQDGAVLMGLADQAAVAIANVQLIAELEASREENAKRADSERSLRQIAARITALRDPDEILQDVVDAAQRLLDADGAHLTRMASTGTYLIPAVVAGGADQATRDWLIGMRFPLGGGINGLAAQDGVTIWTPDYSADTRIPHADNDDEVAARMGLVGMAAVPLRAPGGDVIGTLAVSTKERRDFEPDDLELLQGLADQAAIALTNSNLLERLTQEEARYRYLVQNAPDLIWSIDADARLTFLSEAVERLTGFGPDQLLGEHFGALVHDTSREVAELDWTLAMEQQSQEVRGRLNLRHRDGSAVPAEFIAIATLDPEGKFAGANGSVRDMRERDRLERELRASEDRYRNLASSSPDLVFATDAEGRYTFLSDRATTVLGWDREQALGRPFLQYVAPGWEEAAAASYAAVLAEPTVVHTARIDFLKGDGTPVELEINVLAKVEDGVLVGINGVARDISERLRLERELSQSEERYRFLVQNSPDIVFSTDAEGHFTFLSDAIERMIGVRAGDAIGQHFSILVDPSTLPLAGDRWADLVANPDSATQADLVLSGPDGQRVPVDVRAIGITVDGRFAGIQGATRDVSDKVRLEGELRRQAGELAAGEERAHLARELHDSVTQALFSMTLVSRSIEMLLDRDSDAAREQLGQLRELQREALAEMRALIFELRPGNLEQDGLVRALKTHAAALQGRLGLPIVVESDLTERLPLPAEEVLYRISQEALHNVVKHASAQQVRVDLRREASGVRLRVEDDGKGFDPGAVPDGHLGLAGMRARADRVGAVFSCASRIGEGTTVEVAMGGDVLARLASMPSAATRPEPAPELTSIRDG